MQDVIEWLMVIALWVGVAALTGWIAQRKGRQFRDWFGAGMLLGIVGPLYVLIASGNYLLATEQRYLAQIESRKRRRTQPQ